MLPFLIFCFLFPLPTTHSSNETDLLSLLAFKSAIDLDPNGALNSWNETVHFCSWTGIQCSRRRRDRVFAINLTSQGLVGSLHPHVGNLSFLTTIILHNNSFHGPIPEEIGLLTRLQFVEFSKNSFIGAIPRNMSQCRNLVNLNLIDNKLSGNIPTELGSMSKLEVLRLGENNFSGAIPPSIGNITSLTKLSLLFCGVEGEIPESLAQLQGLQLLQLGHNHFNGTFPSGLFNISAIQIIAVLYNHLHGVIPSNIGLMLPNLKGLFLGGNHFTGPIPVSISNASLLEDINLSTNNFTGPMPNFARLIHLQRLNLGSNPIADDMSFLSSLTNSTELQLLEASDNLLSGSLPDSIANLSSHLRVVYIPRNKINGNIPSGIGNLINLTSLFLSDNCLEGPIPVEIARLSNLHEFDVARNKLTNEVPSLFGNLTSLNRLFLNENNLSGNIPPSLGNCTNLLEFDLSRNNFSGLIPPEIMSLSSVSIAFDLSYNNLEGSIPYEVGSLRNLAALDLSNNRLSGLIPNLLAKCMSLQKLYLQGNLLEGEMPAELRALTGLQDVDLSRNNLCGPIPSFLAKLNLERLNLSFNRLQGEVPITGVFKNKTLVSVDGNEELCGGIPELKLPPCSSVESHKKKLSTLLKILIPILVAGGICFALSAFFIHKRRMCQKNVTPSLPSSINGIQFVRHSYADLFKATGGFAKTNLVGVGRFGSIYKGILDDGQTVVAIKVVNLYIRGASKSFVAECTALRDARHRNLLKILNVCESIDFQGNDFKALIYEFKANGSLEKWLYHGREQEGKQDTETDNLTMIQRLNIAIDIAHAIEYLHFGTDSSIVHGDLKPSNILLDHDMIAYVGDFGLAKIISKIVPSHESSSSIGIRGTVGYVPPEYATNTLVSTQGDVYSYGILLLEMFTNRRPTDEALEDHVNLHDFVSNALPDHVMEVVDPGILIGEDTNRNVKDCMASILSIGVACSRTVPRDRMLITDTVRGLCKIREFHLSERIELQW